MKEIEIKLYDLEDEIMADLGDNKDLRKLRDKLKHIAFRLQIELDYRHMKGE